MIVRYNSKIKTLNNNPAPKISPFFEPSTLMLQAFAALAALAASFVFPKALLTLSQRAGTALEKNAKRASLLLCGILLGVLVAVNRRVLLSFMNSADEHSCYFFALCLRAGKLWAAPHPLKEFFEVPHLGAIGEKWFSVYPPGWPLLWAVALRIGLKDLINPLLTTAAAGIFYSLGSRIYGRGAALLSLVILLISPFFLLTGAAYFSHNACLLTIGVFLLAMLRWEKTGRPSFAVLAGLMLGYGLAIRYLTTAVMALPVLLHWLRRLKAGKTDGKGNFLFLSSAGALVLLHAVYNRLVTGSFLDAPNHFLHSHEKLGFIAGYTPQIAVQYVWQRLLYLLDWTPPFLILFFLAGLGQKKRAWERILQASVLMLPAGYFFYYSWGGNQYGPRYYFEAYPLIALQASSAFLDFLKNKNPAVRKGMMGLGLAMIGLTAPLLLRHFLFFHQVSEERQAVYRAAEEKTEKPALVFLRGFLGDILVLAPEDTPRNTPFLDGPVIYAHDLEDKNKLLRASFPERRAYLASYDRKKHEPVLLRENDSLPGRSSL